MNSLNSDQIIFWRMRYKQEKDFINLGFISKRLWDLIRYKNTKGLWKIMQIDISNNSISYGCFKAVLTAPSKGSILFIKEN